MNNDIHLVLASEHLEYSAYSIYVYMTPFVVLLELGSVKQHSLLLKMIMHFTEAKYYSEQSF